MHAVTGMTIACRVLGIPEKHSAVHAILSSPATAGSIGRKLSEDWTRSSYGNRSVLSNIDINQRIRLMQAGYCKQFGLWT